MTDDEKQRVYWEAEHGFRTYDHPVVEFFARQRIAKTLDWLDMDSVSNALDVGCGDGFSTYYMNEKIPDVIACDRSEVMLKRHPLYDQGKTVVADARELPFDDNSFDLVYGWEILHHISNPSTVLAEMARVSRKYVMVAEPNRSNIFQFGFALVDREHRWVLRYSRKYLRDRMREAGLDVLRTRSGGWIFPNKTPGWLMPILRRMPYWCPIGISNWALGCKPPAQAESDTP